ncbi:MAG: glutamate--tRNA ligase [Spirochaetia bacterium]|nr:glutamate--tRNA ligase [Spirochaetia bacterium]MCF7941829.1 glutamate--tRNA ligase [Spirochaetia bacterium]
MSVRVRYAPSPTGLQHIGGVRTALFNYFFARANGGTFILRIEDTDQERSHEEALEDLYETLAWLGIDWDEGPGRGGDYGPYVQSQRFELYRSYAQQLVADGKAYYCYCTPQRLDALREEQQQKKSRMQGYDRHCRDLTEEQRSAYAAQGITPVIRLKVPLEGKTTFHDELMGDITRKNTDISPDPVLLKSDGFPTYHLANVIDDHLMGITHIMRAQEWIPSGPLHILLYEAFGWDPPKYCHLPMVMGKDGQKLSKRHGSTAVRDFRRAGYLPEAVVNYISLLGWSYDDKTEFFTREELEKVFSLEKINKAPGVFDYKKLLWFNGQYIRQKPAEQLKELILPYLIADGVLQEPITAQQQEVIDRMIPIIHERLRLLGDVSEMTRFLFQDIPTAESAAFIPKKLDMKKTLEILHTGRQMVEQMDGKDDAELETQYREAAAELEVKLGDIMMPLRVAVTGSTISPPLFESLRLLGSEKSLDRLDRAITQISKEVG